MLSIPHAPCAIFGAARRRAYPVATAFVRHAVLRALATGASRRHCRGHLARTLSGAAAPVPAMMTVPTWAGRTGAVRFGAFLADGAQASGSVAACRTRRTFSLDGVGSLKVPYRPPLADVGGWVAEGSPIPVDDLSFGPSLHGFPEEGGGGFDLHRRVESARPRTSRR
ncbi:hypothetical protein F2981_12120 [Sinorhizobium meliloti]|nr:hypothetical protein [Sinorhizobium meliloti]